MDYEKPSKNLQEKIRTNNKIDLRIESLRGFCALTVLLHHTIYYADHLSPGFDRNRFVGGFTFPGHLMVLVFFMLSGYVIGLSYYGKSNFNVTDYIKKRLVRLYPIYLLVILITALVFKEDIRAVAGSLFFMQNLASNNLAYNIPTWTLNHEFIYYLLAIPILKFKPKLKYIFAILIILLLISLLVFPFPRIGEGYLVGFTFWLTGYKMSFLKKSAGFEVSTNNNNVNKFVSLLLLLIACDELSIFKLIFKSIPVKHGLAYFNLSHMVEWDDFSLYPYCLLAIVIAAFPGSRKINNFAALAFLSCWITFIFWAMDGTLFNSKFFYIPMAFLIMSTALFYIKIPILKSFSLLANAGSISYALYLIHTPILEALAKISIINGALPSFLLKVILLFTTTISLSYFLEKKMQPKIKQLIG